MAREAHLQWQGWVASVALHAAIVTVILAAPFNQVIDATDPFRWEVTLVDNTIPAAQTVEAGMGGDASPRGRYQKSPVESMLQMTVKADAAGHRDMEKRNPVEAVRPVHRQVKTRAAVDREEHSRYEVKGTERRELVTAERQPEVMQELRHMPSGMVSFESATIVRPEDHRPQEVNGAESREIITVERQPAVAQELTDKPSGMASAETRAIVGSDAIQHPTAITASDAAQGSTDVRSFSAPTPAVTRSVGGAGRNGPEESESAMQPGAGEGASSEPVERGPRSGQTVPPMASEGSREEDRGPPRSASAISGSGKGTGPDYGWLKRLLWERINRVKAYSDNAVENEWEGRVVMVVTIRSDGRIDEVGVAESSGNGSLDREAAELIARVSPLELDRALGAARVKLRVPMSFGLE